MKTTRLSPWISAALILALIVAIVAMAGLLGYATGMRALSSIRSDYIPMAPSTAGCFLVLSAALCINLLKPLQIFGRMALGAAIILVLIFSLLTVAGSLFGIPLNFEGRLFSEAGVLGGIPVGRMSPATGGGFIVAGFGAFLLLLKAWNSRHVQRLGLWASILGILTALFAETVLLAYLYGAPLMYSGATVPMAATTAIAFLFLGAALVVAVGPDSFFMRLVTGGSTSARLSRVFLPLTVAVVLITSAIARFASAFSVVSGELLLAALVIIVVTITALVVARVSHSIGHSLDELSRKLRQSEERHRTILQTGMDGFWLMDKQGRVLEVNEAYRRMSGYSLSDLQAMDIHDLKRDEEGGDISAYIQRIMEQGVDRFETRHRRKDGSMFDVEVNVQYLPTEGGRFLAFMQDITERKRAVAQVRKLLEDSDKAQLALLGILEDQTRSENDLKQLAAAIEQAAEIIVITNDKGLIQYVNPAFETVTGYTRAEAAGQNMRILRSGRQDESFYRKLWETIGRGTTWKGCFVNCKKNRVLYTAETTISPVRDAAGMIVNYVAVMRDITDELAIQAQLVQAQKMESVGLLAGGVAHDFNNMLQIILGNVGLVLANMAPDNPIRGDLEEVKSAGKRAADLTRQLLAFARKQSIAPRTIYLNDSVESMLKMLRRLIGEDVELVWAPCKDLWPIKMDPVQIDQILANLCVNAHSAIDGVGEVHIGTQNAIVDEFNAARHEGFLPGEYVLLTVSDTGRGMDMETQARIFEPFFTTKKQGKGTGLGLATVYGIVRQNRGYIGVYSEQGKGTTFRIYLPRHAGSDAPPAGEDAVQPIIRGYETVLLVEDEPAILQMTATMLERQGYRVLSANAPGEAMRQSKAHTGDIHLLLTDVIMPEMNGRDLADRLLALRPRLKCLFMSGYTANVIAHHGVLERGVHFIQKPFSMADLGAKVRAVLVE